MTWDSPANAGATFPEFSPYLHLLWRLAGVDLTAAQVIVLRHGAWGSILICAREKLGILWRKLCPLLWGEVTPSPIHSKWGGNSAEWSRDHAIVLQSDSFGDFLRLERPSGDTEEEWVLGHWGLCPPSLAQIFIQHIGWAARKMGLTEFKLHWGGTYGRKKAKEACRSGNMRPWWHLDVYDDTEVREMHFGQGGTGCDANSSFTKSERVLVGRRPLWAAVPCTAVLSSQEGKHCVSALYAGPRISSSWGLSVICTLDSR